MKLQTPRLFLSAVTVAEIRYGLVLIQNQVDRQRLTEWLEYDIRRAFEGRILRISEDIILRWRILMEAGRKSGRTYSQPDLLIAATALEHNLTLVTRNTRDFADIPGLQLLNPWEESL